MKYLNIPVEDFEKKLGYFFKNKSLLEKAITHPSYLTHQKVADFERFEFLGDKVVGIVVTHLLLQKFPKDDEGKLSVRYTNLVNKFALDEIMSAIGIKNDISLFDDCKTTAVYADICEAIIGAMFLDSNYDTVLCFVTKWWNFNNSDTRDPKSKLQEYAQSNGFALPTYTCTKHSDTSFEISVQIKEIDINATGFGHNKKEAEREAAHKANNIIKKFVHRKK